MHTAYILFECIERKYTRLSVEKYLSLCPYCCNLMHIKLLNNKYIFAICYECEKDNHKKIYAHEAVLLCTINCKFKKLISKHNVINWLQKNEYDTHNITEKILENYRAYEVKICNITSYRDANTKIDINTKMDVNPKIAFKGVFFKICINNIIVNYFKYSCCEDHSVHVSTL